MSIPGTALSDEELMQWLNAMTPQQSKPDQSLVQQQTQPPAGGPPDSSLVQQTQGPSSFISGVPDHVVQSALGFTGASEGPQAPAPQDATPQQTGAPSEAPTLSQMYPHGQGTAPASGPVTQPEAPQPTPDQMRQLPPAPRDPFMMPTYVRGQVERNEHDEMDLARQRGDLARQEAEAAAAKTAEQAITMDVAQKSAEDRIKRYQDLQDQTVQRLRSTSDMMLAAANDVSDLYPHGSSPDRVSGNAALALAAGLGSKTAVAMLEQAAEGDKEWDRMAVERHSAKLQGLGQAHTAIAQEFGAYGNAGQDTAAANASMQAARLNMFAKDMDALAKSFGPTQAGIDAGQAAADLRMKSLGLLQSAADNQIKGWMQEVQLGRAMHPTVGNPGEPPPEPVFNDDKHKGESESSYNTRYTQWKNVDMPYWKAKQDAWLRGGAGLTRGGGIPTAPWAQGSSTQGPSSVSGGSKAPTASGSPRGTGGPVTSMTTGQPDDLQRGFGPTTSAAAAPASAPTAPVESPAQRDKDRQYGITFSGGELRLVPGKGPALDATQTGALRKSVANADTLTKDIELYAQLELLGDTDIGTAISRNEHLGDLLKGAGIDTASVSKTAASAIKGRIKNRLMSEFKERSQMAGTEFEKSLLYEPLISLGGKDSDKVKAALDALISDIGTDTADQLTTANYDAAPMVRRIEDVKQLIDGIGAPVDGENDKSAKVGEAAADAARVNATAKGPKAFGIDINRQTALAQPPVRDNGKTGKEAGAQNDAPADYKAGYQVLADRQLDADRAATAYLKAMDDRDYTAAYKAFDQMTKARAEVYKQARELLSGVKGIDDPRAAMLGKRYGWATGGTRGVGVYGWTKHLSDSDLNPFIDEMVRTNGKGLEDLL